ncbi:MAG: hypothetical protein AAFX09_09015 [Pseudomonadota bacterium]
MAKLEYSLDGVASGAVYKAVEAPLSPRESNADREAVREAADFLARTEVADAVTTALNAYQGSLRQLAQNGGPDPATVSRLANGHSVKGGTIATLAQIALAMDKTLKIVIE